MNEDLKSYKLPVIILDSASLTQPMGLRIFNNVYRVFHGRTRLMAVLNAMRDPNYRNDLGEITEVGEFSFNPDPRALC